MSADPVIIVNGNYVETVYMSDWRSYVEQKYPRAKYRLENGYQVMVTLPRDSK